MSFNNLFTGNAVRAALPQFEAIALSADIALLWPTESLEGSPYVAAAIDVDPSTTGLTIAMPDATAGATGVATLITNTGSHSFTLTDTGGNVITVIAASQAFVITLTDNTTANGVWRSSQLAATTSSANSGALAGGGLQAISTQLQSFIQTFEVNSSTAIDSTYRASAVVWSGSGVGTLQLDTIAHLTAGWWFLVNNIGTAKVTIQAAAGETINGVASIDVPVGGSGNPYSVLVVCASDGFYTFAGTPAIIPIDGGGTGADNANNALVNLGGTTIGIDIFTASDAAAVLALLGIGSSAFTETTIAGNLSISSSDINNAYVCTAALTLDLPDSTDPSITKQFIFAAYAQGGDVTVSPVAGDKINGGAAGANFTLSKGASAVFATDAAGNWWPLFFYQTLDSIGGAQGDVLFRGASAWEALAAGTSGYVLMTKGAGADPVWASPSGVLDGITATRGSVLYRGAAAWAALGPGVAGQVLQTAGAGADPAWVSLSGLFLQADAYVAHGAYTWNRPVGCAKIIGHVVGAGGGGASCQATSGNHCNGGGGGGAGAYTTGVLNSPGSTLTVTVGQGGAGGASGGLNAGSSGSASSIGSLLACGGGSGGTAGTDALNSAPAPGGAGGTVTSGGGILANAGQAGGYGCGGNAAVAVGGMGGIGPFGGGAQQATISSTHLAGGNGVGPGCGGGGAAVVDVGTAGTDAGGSGADGAVFIYSFS